MSLTVAATIISIATMIGAVALWALGAYCYWMMPRWLAAFQDRTKCFLNTAQATTEEMRSHGRALDRTEQAIHRVELVVRQEADRVIVAVRDRQFDDAAQSIRGR